MISLIIPIYNQAAKLDRCLASLVAQTYQDLEIIVVNDGSTDQPEQIVAKYQSSFAKPIIFINQTNQGANAARNRGRTEASGDYLLFCDADAYLTEQALERLLKTFEDQPAVSYVYSNFYYGWKLFRPGVFSAQRLRREPFIHTMALIRAKHFPGFDPSLKRFQDWDLWLTMLEQGHQGVWLDEQLFKISTGGHISSWLPSFSYRLLPWLAGVKAYNQAKSIIIKKHGLS